MKRILKTAAVLALAATMVVPVYASELEAQLEEANSRQDELQQEVANSQARLEELQGSKSAIEDKIAEIDAEIAAVDELIQQYSNEEIDKQALIEELESQIDDQEDELAKKYEKMKVRIKYMYENLDANYIEAIFSATSIGDFFEKVEYISALNNYDRRMMDEIGVLVDELEVNKVAVEDELAVVQALGDAQEEQKAVLDDLQVMKSAELSNTEVAIAAEEEEIWALNAMLEENAGQIAALSAEYDAWLAEGAGGGETDPEAEEAARQAEEEAQRLAEEAAAAEEAARQAEEEAARQAEEAARQEEAGQEPETDENGEVIGDVEQETAPPEVYVDPAAQEEAERLRQEAEAKEAERQAAEEEAAQRRQAAENTGGGGGGAGVATGSWIWPVPGYSDISSGFGPRDGGFHYGIDIPAAEGTPIVAVDGGIVVLARWSPGADTGNYTVIYHGNGLYSEYMHQSGLAVGEGQKVSQGEVIGYVGNTGQSYGAHLHLAASSGERYWENRFAPPF